ncbi:MAG: response regulator receiver protein [Atopobiaceae bacterium]|jgi:uncharacterized membrane protein YgcG|nr:response regulator receiver protein [Atopobiaceae bacterium]MCH4119793.1 response regulator receiver protein [Atopobiaceae bacterium]MCI1318331.1 response regulator receiver protein [Atopobiaceae bacterium]MCI1388868.1 response regulator receiver protein [Atopobiaceae bacterium]MCI1432512.1 response regulator receiver protein [Atopobiaceae bacterium]
MPFDPRYEDYLRSGIAFARSLEGADPFGAARAAMGFRRRFERQDDDLPATDADRAFHLVARAAELLDYELPFAGDDEVARIRDDASEMLSEAISLDGSCYDAIRMRDLLRSDGFDAHYRFLSDGVDEVVARGTEARDRALAGQGPDPRLAADLAMRPCLRWLAELATRSLVCGRYRRSVEVSRRLLALDEAGVADAGFTYAFALAKLEDDHGLDRIAEATRDATRQRGGTDPWMLIARMACAHARLDMQEARRLAGVLLGAYPHAGSILMGQDELSDGAFARLAVDPWQEDELVLAVSEAAVLLQEGREYESRGTLGAWVAGLPEVERAVAREAAEDSGAEGGRARRGGRGSGGDRGSGGTDAAEGGERA